MDVVLPRPLGIVFKEDARRQRVVVESFIPGSHADKLAKVMHSHGLHGRCRAQQYAWNIKMQQCHLKVKDLLT